MLRSYLTDLPDGQVIALYREGGDAVLLTSATALAPLPLADRFALYNQLFASLDGDPAAGVTIARVLDLDEARARRKAS